MRRSNWAILLAAAPLCAAANCDVFPPDHEIRAHMTKEEMEAGPSQHRIRGALLNDVRVWRGLDKNAERGELSRPTALRSLDGVLVCVKDDCPWEMYTLKSEPADVPYRVEETAYYCRTSSVYFYRYAGGPKKLDTWQGPFRLERKPLKVEEDQKR